MVGGGGRGKKSVFALLNGFQLLILFIANNVIKWWNTDVFELPAVVCNTGANAGTDVQT